MSTSEGLKVVEFNCRFGDPEAQVVLPLMESSLLDLMMTVASGESLAGKTVATRSGAAVTTVLASGGYPAAYEKGKPISLPSELVSEELIVFHAGTKIQDGTLVSSGGRVLAVTGVGATFEDAAQVSREAAARIEFEGAFFRSDIGWRENQRLEHTE
jgi:phosphoribosylamine--glycine ligase